MRDIWDRPLKIGDLVMFELRYYIVVSDIELYIPDYIVKRAEGNVYLIDNPIEQEKLLYQSYSLKYQNFLKKRMEDKEKKKDKAKQNKSKAELISPGDIVKEINSYNGTYYLYLGEGEYTDFDGVIYSGHLYIKALKDILKYDKCNLFKINPDELKEVFVSKYYDSVRYSPVTVMNQTHMIPIKDLPLLHNQIIKNFKNKSSKFIVKEGHIDLGDKGEEFTLLKRFDCLVHSPKGSFYDSYQEIWYPVKIKLY